MKAKVEELIEKSRTALDEIRSGTEDDFSADLDKELRQALVLSADELLQEAPMEKLLPKRVVANSGDNKDYDAIRTEYSDGHGSLVIPDDFLLLYELRLRSWQGTVRTLLEPGSNEALMQQSRWTRGTPQKPKAMLETDEKGQRVITYWTAGKYANPRAQNMQSVYDHFVEKFTYVPRAAINKDADDTEWIDIALTGDCENNLIYRALSMILTTKKETELASTVRGMSEMGG